MVVKVNVTSSSENYIKGYFAKIGGNILSPDMRALLFTILRESTEKLDKLCHCGIFKRLSHLVAETLDHQWISLTSTLRAHTEYIHGHVLLLLFLCILTKISHGYK